MLLTCFKPQITTQVPERLHRYPGPAERDGGGPVADAVGAQLNNCRHAHQAQGDGQGKLLCLAGIAKRVGKRSIFPVVVKRRAALPSNLLEIKGWAGLALNVKD